MPEARSTWHGGRKIPQLLAGWSYVDDMVSNTITGLELFLRYFLFVIFCGCLGYVEILQVNREEDQEDEGFGGVMHTFLDVLPESTARSFANIAFVGCAHGDAGEGCEAVEEGCCAEEEVSRGTKGLMHRAGGG